MLRECGRTWDQLELGGIKSSGPITGPSESPVVTLRGCYNLAIKKSGGPVTGLSRRLVVVL